MRLRVRVKDVSIELLLNRIALPEVPDWTVDLPDPLPDAFRGNALLLVGSAEVIVGWDFSSGLVTDLLERLRCNEELDSASTWGPNAFRTRVQGNETTANGLLGIMVER